MMAHAFAPKVNAPPGLFGRYILMRDYGLGWEQTGAPLDADDIGELMQMVGVWNQAETMRNKT